MASVTGTERRPPRPPARMRRPARLEAGLAAGRLRRSARRPIGSGVSGAGWSLPAGPGLDPQRLAAAATALRSTAARRIDLAGGGERRAEALAADDDMEAWVIGWPRGRGLQLHDHGESSGAVTVVAGALTETAVRRDRAGALGLRTREATTGDGVLTFGRRHIHDVVNLGDEPALSVHVYSPRLRAMHFYGVVDNCLVLTDTRRLADPADAAARRAAGLLHDEIADPGWSRQAVGAAPRPA